MKLENINNEKFQKLEAFQVENLEEIQGGIVAASYTSMSSAGSISTGCISITMPWNDTNPGKESCQETDNASWYMFDSTLSQNDHVRTCNESDPASEPIF